MDAVGLILSAALCTGVFVAFDLLVRLLGDAVGEVRYTVAPTLLGGLHAWRRSAVEPVVGPGPGPADDDGGDGRDQRRGVGYRDPGLEVPVTRVTGRMTRCAGA